MEKIFQEKSISPGFRCGSCGSTDGISGRYCWRCKVISKDLRVIGYSEEGERLYCDPIVWFGLWGDGMRYE